MDTVYLLFGIVECEYTASVLLLVQKGSKTLCPFSASAWYGADKHGKEQTLR